MTIANTPTRSRSGPVWQLFDHQVARAVNCFIAVAKYVGQVLEEQRKFPPEKIQTIYYGTSSPAEVTGEDIAALRQQVGISPGHLVIAMAARISPEKGHRYLLSALAKIRPQIGENISVLIMGDGPARENIQTQARALGLDEMVTFTGYLPNAEVLRLLAACDLVTLPSEIEGLPYMITEAMSLGKTVVATQVGGIPEQIIHGKTGLLVPPHNVDALAETLLQLINNPSLLQHMGKEAQKRHRELFSLERMIQEHETLYHTFINNVNRKI
jgi:glycosyltransferase involved in cell wall biosynthesis